MMAVIISIRQCKKGYHLLCMGCGHQHTEEHLSRAIRRAQKHGKRCERFNGCWCGACKTDIEMEIDRRISKCGSIVVVYR